MHCHVGSDGNSRKLPLYMVFKWENDAKGTVAERRSRVHVTKGSDGQKSSPRSDIYCRGSQAGQHVELAITACARQLQGSSCKQREHNTCRSQNQSDNYPKGFNIRAPIT